MSNGEQPKVENCERRRQYIRGILALTTNTAFLFVVVWIFIMKQMPQVGDPLRDTFNQLIGALIVLVTGVNWFYFGSTQGSQDKTELLAGE